MYNRSNIKKAVSEFKEKDKVDNKLLKEHDYHKKIMEGMGREEAIQNLGNHYTMRAFAESPDDPLSVKLRNMMGQYYYYLKKYDRDFMKKLRNLVKEMISMYLKDPDSLEKDLARFQGPDQGGNAPAPGGDPAGAAGAGGGIPQMGSSKKQIKTAGHVLYLNRKEGNYILKNTLAGKILRGVHHVVNIEGRNKILYIEQDTVVQRTGPTAKVVIKIQEELPEELRNKISTYLKDNGIKDSEYASRMLVDKYIEKGSFDLRPISVRFGGPSLGFLLYRDVGIIEPEKTHNLRKIIGESFSKFIDELKSALDMENIEISEKSAKMPKHSRLRKKDEDEEEEDRHPTREPRRLSTKESDTSLDVSSLIITISNQQSSSKEKLAAIDRLIKVIASHPKAYRNRKLTENDVTRLSLLSGGKSDPVIYKKTEILKNIVKLFESSDSEIIEAYNTSDESYKQILAMMISSQDRDQVMKIDPEIAVRGKSFYNIDISDEQGMEVLKKALKQGKHSKSLENKAMEALYKEGDEELLHYSIHTDGILKDLAISILIEMGGEEDKLKAIAHLKGYKKKFKSIRPVLIAVAIVGNAPEFISEAASLQVSPEEISSFLGRGPALKYMKSARVGWDGAGLPEASSIYSLTENPLPMIRNYYELAADGDKNSLASLHKIYHLMTKSENKDFSFGHAFNFLSEIMEVLKQDTEMLEHLLPKRSEQQCIEAKMLPNGSVMTKCGGVYAIKGTNIVFSSSSKDAVKIAVSKLSQSRKKRV